MAELPMHARRMDDGDALSEVLIRLSPQKISKFKFSKPENETRQDTGEAEGTQLERRAWESTACSSSASSSQLVPSEPGGGVLEIEASAIQRDGETFNVSMSAEIDELHFRLDERELWKAKLERLLHRKMNASSLFTLSRAFSGLFQATHMRRVLRTRVERTKPGRVARCCLAVLHAWGSITKEQRNRRSMEDEVVGRTLLTVEQRMVVQERDTLRGEIEEELGRHLMTCQEVHRMLEGCHLRTAYDRFVLGCRLVRGIRDAADAAASCFASSEMAKRDRQRAWNEWASGTRQRIMAGELDQNRARVEEVMSLLREQSAVVVLETDCATQAMEATGLRTRIAQLLHVPDGTVGVLRHNGRLAEISLQSAQRKSGEEMLSALELGEELVEKWSAGEQAQTRAEARAGRGARVVGRMDRGICNLLAGWCVEMSALEVGAQNAVREAEAKVRMLESEGMAREAEHEEERARAAKERESAQGVQREKDALTVKVEALQLQLAREVEEKERKKERLKGLEEELGELIEENRQLRQQLQSSEAKSEAARLEYSRLGEESNATLATEQRKVEKLNRRLAESEEKTTKCEFKAEQLQGALVTLEEGLRGAWAEAAAAELALQELDKAKNRLAAADSKVLLLEKELGSALRALWSIRKATCAGEGGGGELGLVLVEHGRARRDGEREGGREDGRSVEVLAVKEGSAAALSREICAGDEIVGVGGQLVAGVGMERVRGLLRGSVGRRVLVQGRRALTGEEYAVMLAYRPEQSGGLSPEVIGEEVTADAAGWRKRAREGEEARQRVEAAWAEERRAVREAMAQLQSNPTRSQALPDGSQAFPRECACAARVSDVNANPRLADTEPFKDKDRSDSARAPGRGGAEGGCCDAGAIVGEVRALVQRCTAEASLAAAGAVRARAASERARAEMRSAALSVAEAARQRQQLRATFRELRGVACAKRRRAERIEAAARMLHRRFAAGVLQLGWRCWARAAEMAALKSKVGEVLGFGHARSTTAKCWRGWLRLQSVATPQTESITTQTERTRTEGVAIQTERTQAKDASEVAMTQPEGRAQPEGARSPVKVVSSHRTQTDGTETPVKRSLKMANGVENGGSEDWELFGSPWGKGRSLV